MPSRGSIRIPFCRRASAAVDFDWEDLLMGTGVRGEHPICRLVVVLALLSAAHGFAQETHFLYVAVPGIRNYVEYGGVGILVFDIDRGYRFVKRIPTWAVPPGKQPENVKGIAASAETGKLYVSTMNRMAAFD